MADDHTAQAISAYGSSPIPTPNIDSIAEEGALYENCYCTNSICAPSRACILTGNYGHKNGVPTLFECFDTSKETFVHAFHRHGYQTGMIGKWHLGNEKENLPQAFDYYEILLGHGSYMDTEFQTKEGIHREKGYATELISKKTTDFIRNRDKTRPFLLFSYHKAPHRNWVRSPKKEGLYKDFPFPFPETFYDDYSTRCPAAYEARMRIEDLSEHDLKHPFPEGLSKDELKRWKYQRYMEDYYATASSIDDAIGELKDCLKEEGIYDDTILIYTSDQGFYLGEHGWFDKRFMYTESLRMPFVLQCPSLVKAEQKVEEMISNVDFGKTLMSLVGIDPSEYSCQGKSRLHGLLDKEGKSIRPEDEVMESLYYRYIEHPSEHEVLPHYGIMKGKKKLIFFYEAEKHWKDPEYPGKILRSYWEYYDLEKDPNELKNRIHDPNAKEDIASLRRELRCLQEYYEDTPVEECEI